MDFVGADRTVAFGKTLISNSNRRHLADKAEDRAIITRGSVVETSSF